MSGRYLGWAKLHGGWTVVTQGDSLAECMRHLMDWIRARGTPPRASAVRPAGTHPDGQGDASGPPSGQNGPGVSLASPRGRGTRPRKGKG
jgi:hypothetical protein